MSWVSLPPLGEVDVDLEGVREGALYRTVPASFEGRALLIKTPRDQPGECWSGGFSGVQTSLWRGTTQATHAYPVLLDQLLTLEREQIRASQGAWNHSAVALGFWDISWFLNAPSNTRAALAMPRHPGVPFSALPRDEQRGLFPRLVHALLDAIRAAPHGDLTASNIVVDVQRGRFALVDPGVTLWCRRPHSPERRDLKPGMQRGQRDQAVFTTTAAAYPLFPPQHAVALGASWAEHVDALAATQYSNLTVSSNRSAAADVFALGVLYFEILTGKHPLPAYAQAPFWTGDCGEAQDTQTRLEELARLRQGLPGPAEVASVRPHEDHLCRALLSLQLES